MLVFDLPSFPYVFKVIKDFFPAQKETTRERSRASTCSSSSHDRVGRMADTLEYSDVAFPLARFDEELVAELREFCAEPPRGGTRRARDPPRLHRAAHDPAQHLPAGGDARADRRRRRRIRQRDQGPGSRQHLPRRHAVEELRRHPPRQGRLLRLRRDRVPDRLHLSQGARGAHRGGRAARARSGTGSARRTSSPRPSRPSCSAIPWCARSSSPTMPTCSTPAFWQGHKQEILAGYVHDVFPYEAQKRFETRRQRAALSA